MDLRHTFSQLYTTFLFFKSIILAFVSQTELSLNHDSWVIYFLCFLV